MCFWAQHESEGKLADVAVPEEAEEFEESVDEDDRYYELGLERGAACMEMGDEFEEEGEEVYGAGIAYGRPPLPGPRYDRGEDDF